MLTDDRIEELCWTDLDRRLLSFARAIEAEVTKPCVCGDSSAQGVFHRNDGPCYIAVEEATKPQEPIKLNIVRKWPEGFQDRLQCVWLDVVSFTANVKMYDLQRVLAEFGFAMEIYEGNATPQPCQSCDEKKSYIDVFEGRYADLTARCAELEDFCISQGDELAKLDEKVFDQDRLLKQQAEKISATLVALAGLPDGALDGGWTYAGMNKYALGLEAKCAELEAECAAMRENSKRWHGLFDTAVASLERSENNTVIKELEADRDIHKAKFEAINKDFDAMEAERDALAITVQQMREAIKRQLEADDRLMNAPFNVSKEEYEAALEDHSASHDAFVKLINEKLINEPDTTVNIIKLHDAAVLAEVVERIIDAASAGSETGVEVVRTMIKEIGAQL